MAPTAMDKVTISICSVIFKVDHIESEVEQVHAGSRKKKLDRDVSCDRQRKSNLGYPDSWGT